MKRLLLLLLLAAVPGPACGPGYVPATPPPPAAAPPPPPAETPPPAGDGTEGGEEEEPREEESKPEEDRLPRYWVPERDAQGWPLLQPRLEHYALHIAPEQLQRLEERLWDYDLLVPARFSAFGHTWDVEVSYRGRSTRKAPKKSFQVRFPKDQRFMGKKRIELLAEYGDGGGITEKFWYDTAASLGLTVPMARFVTLEVNGQHQGVMTELESVTKDFLLAHGLDEDADIYRCGMYDCDLRPPPQRSYQEPWDKRTNEDAPWDGLWGLFERLNRTPPQGFAAVLEQSLDVDAFLTWMALDALLANDYQTDSRSYLVYEPGTGKWRYVPWDLNNARSELERNRPADQAPRARHSIPSFTAWDPRAYDIAEFRQELGYVEMRPAWCTVRTRILMDAGLRARYVKRLRALLEGPLREEVLGPRIDATSALVAGPLAEDPYALPGHVAMNATFLRRHVRERRAFLLQQLGTLERITEQGPLKLDRVGRDGAGRLFVQVLNTSAAPVSLEGLLLTGDLRDPKRAVPLPGIVLPAGSWATFWENPAEGELALPAPVDPLQPEVGLFSADGRRPLDLLWLPRQGYGEALGRVPRGGPQHAPVTEGPGAPPAEPPVLPPPPPPPPPEDPTVP